MSLNKKNLLAAAIGAMLFASAAQAQVVLGTDPALLVAEEIEDDTLLDPTDGSTANDVVWTVGYNFSNGEVRYGSLKCTANIELVSTGVAVTSPDADDITLGAVNGNGSEVLFFSMTGVVGAGDGVTDDIEIEIDVDATVLDKENVDCEFGIYDTPSQAQAGGGDGSTGNIFATGQQPYITRGPSYVFSATAGVDTADVEADPAFTLFVTPTDTVGDFNGNLRFNLASPLPVNIDLDPIAMADLFDTDTTVTVSGDFTAAADVVWGVNSPDTLNDGAAVYEYTSGIPALGITDDVDYIPNAADAIQISDYSAELDPVFNAGYELVQNHTALNAGEINRNGTELLAPLAQIPANWLSRIALHNTGSEDRVFNVELIPATGGSTVEPDSTFGGDLEVTNLTIEGGQTLVLAVDDLFPAADFTGPARGTIKVTAEAPRSQMNGLYQIVNPVSGSISNHVMVEPGTN